MDVLTLFIDKHIGRIENEENNDLVEIYNLFYDERINYLILHYKTWYDIFVNIYHMDY